MDDIELTEKIRNLKWDVDLEKGTCYSELMRYRVVRKKDYTDLKSEWISPDIPAAVSVINEIQRGATAAVLEALKNE